MEKWILLEMQTKQGHTLYIHYPEIYVTDQLFYRHRFVGILIDFSFTTYCPHADPPRTSRFGTTTVSIMSMS